MLNNYYINGETHSGIFFSYSIKLFVLRKCSFTCVLITKNDSYLGVSMKILLFYSLYDEIFCNVDFHLFPLPKTFKNMYTFVTIIVPLAIFHAVSMFLLPSF